jgi:hypothetical protein
MFDEKTRVKYLVTLSLFPYSVFNRIYLVEVGQDDRLHLTKTESWVTKIILLRMRAFVDPFLRKIG